MNRRILTYLVSLVAVVAIPVVPAQSAGVSSPAAQGVRFGDHAAFVRVVVDFSGGSLSSAQVEADDPQPYDGASSLVVSPARLGSRAPRVITREGLTVRLATRSRGLHIAITSTRGRLKYLSYSVLSGPRLVIDLWKAAPPMSAAQGTPGCLRISSSSRQGGAVTATGSERGVFENQLRIVLRGANGRVLAARGTTAANGRWRSVVRYHSAASQTGTLEAVAASPKDGSLACLTQVRISLPAA
jgi:hypothetical protein